MTQLRSILLALAALLVPGLGHAAQPDPTPLPALAPENLAKSRPKPPFDVTGTWVIDMSTPRASFFGPPYPKLTPQGAGGVRCRHGGAQGGRVFRDWSGQCLPVGLPMMMTVPLRPVAMIQLPTAIYMFAEFQSQLRIVHLDGRKHSGYDTLVPGWGGESIGHWEGDTLVVDTRGFAGDRHQIDFLVLVSDQFRVIERITLSRDRTRLHVRSIMTDPKGWEGEWTVDKTFVRSPTDVKEFGCEPVFNE